MSSIEENLHGRDERDEEELDDLEWWARWGVYVSGTLLASFFGWLLLSRSQVVQALSNTAPELIVKAGLIIYFGAWVFGAPFDLTMQRAVLAKDPDKGRVDLKSVLVFSGIPILGGVVFWASTKDIGWMSVALFIFWAYHTWTLHYMYRFLIPKISLSATWYLGRRDYFGLEKLMLIKTYQFGPSIIYKHAVGFILCAFFVVVSLVPYARQTVALLLVPLDSELSATTWASLVPALAFCLFVAAMEGFQWTIRLNARSSLRVMNNLRRSYRLSLRQG
jgi:hypothetical protein